METMLTLPIYKKESKMKKVMDRVEKLMGLDSDIKNDKVLDGENVRKCGNESSNNVSNENFVNENEMKTGNEDSKIDDNGDDSTFL